MRPIPEIEADLASLNEQIRPLMKDRESIERELREAKSKEWIRVNGVTLDKVQLSTGDGIPWHGTIDDFSKWLNANQIMKPFCEWNGGIHRTSDVRLLTHDWKCCGELRHVPKQLE